MREANTKLRHWPEHPAQEGPLSLREMGQVSIHVRDEVMVRNWEFFSVITYLSGVHALPWYSLTVEAGKRSNIQGCGSAFIKY